jgi:hypothetical protein
LARLEPALALEPPAAAQKRLQSEQAQVPLLVGR